MTYRSHWRSLAGFFVAGSLLTSCLPAGPAGVLAAEAAPHQVGAADSGAHLAKDVASSEYDINTLAGFTERWNPCRPIPYRIDAGLVGLSGLGQARSAVRELSRVSGLTFVYEGYTMFTPQPGDQLQPAPLVIAFSRAGNLGVGSAYLWGGAQLGDGGYTSRFFSFDGQITSDQIKSGFVVIDAAKYRRLPAASQRSLLLHELGHAVGLNHAKDASELMYPVISDRSPATYASGDLDGLALVGATAGCISSPAN